MNQITLPLDIKSLEVLSQRIDSEGNIVLKVRSTNDRSTCHKCGKPATKLNGHAPMRRIQHLPIFETPVYLATDCGYRPKFCRLLWADFGKSQIGTSRS